MKNKKPCCDWCEEEFNINDEIYFFDGEYLIHANCWDDFIWDKHDRDVKIISYQKAFNMENGE